MSIGKGIRRATVADVQAIQELTCAAYAKWVPVIGRDPKPMGADYDKAVRQHVIDLVYADGTLVALVETIPGTDHLLIENLAVLPAQQGRGYGRKLLAHVERSATANGYREIRLYTNKRFVENIRFYGGVGYRIVREEAFMGGLIVHMTKPV